MNRRKLIADIKQEFMLKRIRAQEKVEDYIENLKLNSQFSALYTLYNKKNIAYIKSKFEEENIELKHQAEDLKAEIDKYLLSIGENPANLVPQYQCKICNDTGVVGGQMCKCLLNELNYQISKKCSSQSTFKSFEECNLNIMNDTDKKAMETLKTWCSKYPQVSKCSINIFGGAGSGKTFLLECIANEMIKQGYSVCYKTAFDLNDLARQYHIGKSFEFSDCLTADILIIDDLGTEPILKNVTKEYLYNVINSRQIGKLPTIISTNLSLNNILDRYDERIFSRLANKVLSLNILLDSTDKRLK